MVESKFCDTCFQCSCTVYCTPALDILLLFSQSQKNSLAIKEISKPLLHAKFQADWFETMDYRSDSKSISDSDVWCTVMSDSESKNPRPIPFIRK